MNQGKFIVFEGIDGSGKSTQIAALHEYLLSKGIPTERTFEPTDSVFGSLIRQCLRGEIETDEKTIAALFVADRLDHLHNQKNGLIRKINEGITVLSDRYYFSSYAYHGAYLPMDWVIGANRLAAEALRPDLTVFLDLAPEVAMERIGKRGEAKERYEKLESLRLIRQKYFEAFEKLSGTETVRIVNCDGSAQETAQAVRAVVEETLF